MTYKGPEVLQQIQVNVVSYAFKMRNGMQLGDCTILLDDLVHARTARVLKQPLLSPDHKGSNGSVIINAARHDPRESGTWVQLHLSAHWIPWITPSGDKTNDAHKGSLPNVFFEVWQQSSEGEKQVYKSEVTKRNRDPDWWPLALQGRKLGGEIQHDSKVWVRFWNQRLSNDDSEAIAPVWIGECRLNMHEMVPGKKVPILDKWPDSAFNRELPVEKGQPQLIIQDCKWVKLAQDAKLECAPKYKRDMDFLKELMNKVDLDAATKESCLSCYHFVESRAKLWAMKKILKGSEKFDAPPRAPAVTEDPLGLSRVGGDISMPLPVFVEKKRKSSAQASTQSDLRSASHAHDYHTAHHHLEEHIPVTRKRQSQIWRDELHMLHRRCSLRADSTSSPRGYSASSTPFEQPGTSRNAATSDMPSFRARSLLSTSQTLEDVSAVAGTEADVAASQGQEQGDSQQSAAKSKAMVPRLPLGDRDSDGKAKRPQSAHVSSGNGTQVHKKRPSTARARAGGSKDGDNCEGRQRWRPSSARSRALSSRPLSARSIATSMSDGGTSVMTPALATLQVVSAVGVLCMKEWGAASGYLRVRQRIILLCVCARATSVLYLCTACICTHIHTHTHTYVYRHMTLEHICQFRESIRPLLANVMRQGSENQHPSEVRPVSVSRLTPTGKFRFSNNYI